MIDPRYRFMLWLVPLIALGLLLIVAWDPSPAGRHQHVGIGYLLGTVFAHATLAAAWSALGPLPAAYRLPLSLGWIAAATAAVAINIAWHGGPDEVPLILGACLVGEWLLVQIPLWGLAVGYGLRLHYGKEAAKRPQPGDLQFGTRQLMILTAIVAVVLGIGRMGVSALAAGQPTGPGGEAPIFAFLAVAGMTMLLPLVLAALLARFAVGASLGVLVLMALFTAGELPLMEAITPRSGPDFWHFVWINGFSALWVLAVAASLRLGGYALRSGRAPPS